MGFSPKLSDVLYPRWYDQIDCIAQQQDSKPVNVKNSPAGTDSGPLSDRVYARIVDALLRGEFTTGGKLPTEGELVARFGVSRATVREALARLRSDGVIESRRGSGSHVIRAPHPPVATTTLIKSLADIDRYYAFRSCVESGAAAAAAEFRSAEDLAAIRAAYDALASSHNIGPAGIELDVRFHLALARSSHNAFFVSTIETSVAPIRQFMELAGSYGDGQDGSTEAAVNAEHLAIVVAVERQDAVQAAEAARQHVLNARRRIFEGTRLV